jgi:hypothetical protein
MARFGGLFCCPETAATRRDEFFRVDVSVQFGGLIETPKTKARHAGQTKTLPECHIIWSAEEHN